MNEKERKGCIELLDKLSDAELFSLVDTVTKKQIKVTTRKDAVKAISTYSESSLELLKRKKIKRDTLFQYMTDKNIFVSVNADKPTLIFKILNIWGSRCKQEPIELDDDDSDSFSLSGSNQSCGATTPSSSSSSLHDTESPASAHRSSSSTALDAEKPSASNNINFSIKKERPDDALRNVPVSIKQEVPSPSISHSYNASSNQHIGNSSANHGMPVSPNQQPSYTSHDRSTTNQVLVQTVNQHVTVIQHSVISSTSHTQTIGSNSSASHVVSDGNSLGQGDQTLGTNRQTFGETFASWFFKSLNSHNPQNSDAQEDFGPQHFWDDSKLMVVCNTPHRSQDEYSGSVLVSQRLLAYVKEELLLFNPNISREGVFVKSNPHGMLIVLVCGTIHRTSNCLGTFEQMFGLVADSRLNDNWKVKIMKLNLQSESVTALPKLTDRTENEIKALCES